MDVFVDPEIEELSLGWQPFTKEEIEDLKQTITSKERITSDLWTRAFNIYMINDKFLSRGCAHCYGIVLQYIIKNG